MADGIELGKAYVQIVPSAQGIKSALTEMFDEETEALASRPAEHWSEAGRHPEERHRGGRHRQDHL